MPMAMPHDADLTGDEALYRRLVDLAPDAMVGVDSSGAIVLVNTQAEVLFGYHRTDLIGERVEVLVPDSARAVHPGHRAAYLADPTPRPMGLGLQLAARRSDGSQFPAEISLAAVDTARGRIVSVSIRDITDRLAAEREREQLAEQAELERIERQVLQSRRLESLGQLAGGIAHDFNNLLAVISNYAAFVRKEIDAELTRTGDARWRVARRDIGHIEHAADGAAQLTRQLLTFARRDVVNARAIDLNDVVSETVGLLERTLGEDIELDVRLATGLAPVLADPGQFQQVLVNLAINARHAMPAGGVLTIVTAADDGDGGDDAEQSVLLTVADTGTGMAPDVLARAFEPFFTTRTADQGTGLGLATVYGIVTQSGGTASLASQVGVGTTFTARIPVTETDAVWVSESADHAAAVAGTVLVIDDEAGIRDVAERILVRSGYDVVVAATADEAVACIERQAVDLVLSDVVMPGVSGPAVMERLRTLRPGLPVLFMSGYAGPELAERSSMGDDTPLLEKPFTEHTLLDAVAAAIGR